MQGQPRRRLDQRHGSQHLAAEGVGSASGKVYAMPFTVEEADGQS
jgi:hypothetical protein